MSFPFTAIIVFLVSIITIALGLYQYFKSKRLLQTGTFVEGIVYENTTGSTSSDNATTYYPVVRFVTKQEEWITEKSSVSGFYKKGQIVKICYSPDNPKEFVIDSWQNRIIPVVITLSGIIIFLLASISLFLTGQLFTFYT